MEKELAEKSFRFADLFAGAGGLSLGFKMAGFEPVFAVEFDKTSAATYEKNFGAHVFGDDIRKIPSFSDINADIIIGGPPCQGFSPLGKMSTKNTRRNEHQKMNALWEEYLRAVRDIKPLAFVIENVPEFIRSEEYATFKKAAEKIGYSVAEGVLRAEEFGVPQKRRRGFAIALKYGTPTFPPRSGERNTVRQAICDLPLEPDGKELHFGRNPTPKSVERYKAIPQGGNRFDLMRKRPDLCPACWLKKLSGSTDVFGRLNWDEPALTIRTEFFKPEKGRYLHPEANRPITHREAARLQTFPDTFVFSGNKTDIARQIGNAVPPKLAFHIAKHVYSLLANNEPQLDQKYVGCVHSEEAQRNYA